MDMRDAAREFQHANGLFREGRFQEALQLLNELDAAFPNNKKLLYSKALCLQKMGRLNEAIVVCDQLILLFGDGRALALKCQLEASSQGNGFFDSNIDLLADLDKPKMRSRPQRRARWMTILLRIFVGISVSLLALILVLLLIAWIGMPQKSFIKYRQARPKYVQAVEAPGKATDTPASDGTTLSILDESSYHGATRSSLYTEAWPEDKGGVLYLFLQSNNPKQDEPKEIRVNGKPLSAYDSIRWWRMWPPKIGGAVPVATVTIKAVDAPLARGSQAEVEVEMASGAKAKRKLFCATPFLRLANVLPDQGLRTLFIHVRNDGDTPVDLQTVSINEQCFALGASDRTTMAGGVQPVSPNQMCIIKVSYPEPLLLQQALAVRVKGQSASLPVAVGAAVRLVEPGFVVGTWNSELHKCNPEYRVQARKLGIDTCVNYSDWDGLNRMAEQFNIRTLSISNREDLKSHPPDLDKVRSQTGNRSIEAWSVHDEPELHHVSSTSVFDNVKDFWNNDATHPAFLNLMTTAAFNEFGHIPDIVCMDHYTMFAPNCIEWTGSLRKAQMEEAIEYTMLLKENTEPVRMWTWTQLCAEVWGRPPIPWGIDYQFWGQVMCGAKGMLWFVYGPGRENKFPAQIQKGEEIIRRLGPIRSLCYYGEPVNNVKTSDRRIIARSLVTEDTLIVIAINDNCSNTGLTFHSAFRISPVHTSLTVSLPSWITPETVAYVSKDGELRAANCSQNKGDISFGDVVFDEEPRIYLIGKKDIQPPQKVTGLNAVSMANNDVALTWKEPYDNYGIRGYTVYRNSRRIDDTPYPVYVASGKNQDDTVTFAVQPFDASGNRGPMSDPVTVRKAP